MKQKVIEVLHSKLFKKATVIIGSALAIGSILISVNPALFLKTGYAGVFLYGALGPVTMIIPAMSQHYNLYLLSAAASAGVVVNDVLAYIVGRNADVFIPKSKKAL